MRLSHIALFRHTALPQELLCDRYAECSAVTGELLAETFEDISRMAALTTTDKGAQSSEGCVIC